MSIKYSTFLPSDDNFLCGYYLYVPVVNLYSIVVNSALIFFYTQATLILKPQFFEMSFCVFSFQLFNFMKIYMLFILLLI